MHDGKDWNDKIARFAIANSDRGGYVAAQIRKRTMPQTGMDSSPHSPVGGLRAAEY